MKRRKKNSRDNGRERWLVLYVTCKKDKRIEVLFFFLLRGADFNADSARIVQILFHVIVKLYSLFLYLVSLVDVFSTLLIGWRFYTSITLLYTGRHKVQNFYFFFLLTYLQRRTNNRILESHEPSNILSLSFSLFHRKTTVFKVYYVLV